MKVVLVNNLLELGGAEVSLCRIAKIISEHHHDVTVITMRQAEDPYKYLPREVGYNFVVYDGIYPNLYTYIKKRGYNAFYHFFHSRLLAHKINDMHADICISFKESRPYLNAVVNCNAKKRICWLRHDISDNIYAEYIYKSEKEWFLSKFKQLDYILFVTNNSMQNFTRLFPLTEKSHYIYNSIDPDSARANSLKGKIYKPDAQVVFVCVGRITQMKGQYLLADAVRILNQKGLKDRFCVWLIGESDNTIDPIKLKVNNLIQMGYQANPFPYMLAADTLICPSLSEGCPNVFLEAMSLGKPILATKTSGASELLNNGEYGLLADISAEGIATCMEQMLSKNIRSEFAEKSLCRVKHFTNDAVYSEMKKIFLN